MMPAGIMLELKSLLMGWNRTRLRRSISMSTDIDDTRLPTYDEVQATSLTRPTTQSPHHHSPLNLHIKRPSLTSNSSKGNHNRKDSQHKYNKQVSDISGDDTNEAVANNRDSKAIKHRSQQPGIEHPQDEHKHRHHHHDDTKYGDKRHSKHHKHHNEHHEHHTHHHNDNEYRHSEHHHKHHQDQDNDHHHHHEDSEYSHKHHHHNDAQPPEYSQEQVPSNNKKEKKSKKHKAETPKQTVRYASNAEFKDSNNDIEMQPTSPGPHPKHYHKTYRERNPKYPDLSRQKSDKQIPLTWRIAGAFVGYTPAEYDSPAPVPDGYMLRHTKSGYIFLSHQSTDVSQGTSVEDAIYEHHKYELSYSDPIEDLGDVYGLGILIFFDFIRFLIWANFFLFIVSMVSFCAHLYFDQSNPFAEQKIWYWLYIVSYSPSVYYYWLFANIAGCGFWFILGPLYSARVTRYYKKNEIEDFDDGFKFDDYISGNEKYRQRGVRLFISYGVVVLCVIASVGITYLVCRAQAVTTSLDSIM